jgi:hypothetical protein
VRLLSLICFLAFLAIQAPAHASRVAIEEDNVAFIGLPGETNRVGVARDGAAVLVYDETAVTTGVGCESIPGGARCTGATSRFVMIDLGDGDDTVTCAIACGVLGGDGADRVHGSPEDDHLNGGPGADALVGAAGNDVYYAGTGDDHVDADSFNGDNGGWERVECGPGDDEVRPSITSNVKSDCEWFVGDQQRAHNRFAGRSTTSGSWQLPQAATFGQPLHGRPHVAAVDGGAIFGWTEGDPRQAIASFVSSDGTFGNRHVIANDLDVVQAVPDHRGGAYVLAIAYNGMPVLAHRSAGGAWANESLAAGGSPRIAVGPGGDVVLVYWRSGSWWQRRRAFDGPWSPDARLTEQAPETTLARDPAVAADASGRTFLAWPTVTGSYSNQMMVAVSDGDPVAPRAISAPERLASSPRLEALPRGPALLVFDEHGAGGPSQVRVAQLDAPKAPVNVRDLLSVVHDAHHAGITTNAAGYFRVATAQTGGGSTVWSGSSLADLAPASTWTLEAVGLAGAPSGRGIVALTDGWNAFTAGWDADGTPGPLQDVDKECRIFGVGGIAISDTGPALVELYERDFTGRPATVHASLQLPWEGRGQQDCTFPDVYGFQPGLPEPARATLAATRAEPTRRTLRVRARMSCITPCRLQARSVLRRGAKRKAQSSEKRTQPQRVHRIQIRMRLPARVARAVRHNPKKHRVELKLAVSATGFADARVTRWIRVKR